MPSASVRAGRGTRVSGGPVFWLVVGPFIGALWLMGLMLKATILLIAWVVREWSAARARKAVAAGALARRPAVAAQVDAEPRDAVPPGFE